MMTGLKLTMARAVMTALALAAVAIAPVVAAPANDRRENATVIDLARTSLPTQVQQPTEGATAQHDKQPGCARAGQIVWFVIPNSPVNNFTVTAGGYDTVLAVYEGGPGGKEIACATDSGGSGGSRVTLTGQAGKTLYVAVGVCCDKKATTTAQLFLGIS